MPDVLIVGAGPAGLIAARTLAEAGRGVLVVEEHPAIGLPVHCTGILGIEAFDELDLPRETICTVNGAARFHSAAGRSVLVESDTIRAAIVDRGAFDAALAARATAAGAVIETGVRLQEIDVRHDRIVARPAGGGRLREARTCVLACGANYRFNRQLGLGVPRAFMQSAQIELPLPPADGSPADHVEVYLGREIAPGGFGWLVPFTRDGRRCARIGLTCETKAASRFDAFVARLLDGPGGSFGTRPAPRLKILPLGPVMKTYGRRVLAVGDAAGLVKPTTGGGIYYSGLSGRLAGEMLDEALARDRVDEAGLQQYERRWQARLGADIRAGLAFRKLASRLDDGAIDAIVELARVDGLVPLLERTADFNWHRRAALALLRHGAFRRILVASLWT